MASFNYGFAQITWASFTLWPRTNYEIFPTKNKWLTSSGSIKKQKKTQKKKNEEKVRNSGMLDAGKENWEGKHFFSANAKLCGNVNI